MDPQTFAWQEPTREKLISALQTFDEIADDGTLPLRKGFFIAAVQKYQPFSVWEDVTFRNYLAVNLNDLYDQQAMELNISRFMGKKDPLYLYTWMDCLWAAYFASGSKSFAERVINIPDPTGVNQKSFASIVQYQGLHPLRD